VLRCLGICTFEFVSTYLRKYIFRCITLGTWSALQVSDHPPAFPLSLLFSFLFLSLPVVLKPWAGLFGRMQVPQAPHTGCTSFLCIGDFAGKQEQAVVTFRAPACCGTATAWNIPLLLRDHHVCGWNFFQKSCLCCVRQGGHAVLSGVIDLHSHRLRRVL